MTATPARGKTAHGVAQIIGQSPKRCAKVADPVEAGSLAVARGRQIARAVGGCQQTRFIPVFDANGARLEERKLSGIRGDRVVDALGVAVPRDGGRGRS